jgi:hypothetical protein
MQIPRPHYYFLCVRFGAMDRNSSLAFGSPLLHSSSPASCLRPLH